MKLNWLIPTWKQYKDWSLPSKLTFYGTYLGIVSLGLTVVIFLNSEAIRDAIALSSKRQVLTGLWEAHSDNPETKPFASILISRETESLLLFNANSSNGAHACNAEGFAEFDGRAFVYKTGDCRVEFLYDHRTEMLDVNYDPDCNMNFCGMRASLAWRYARVDPYFVEIGLLNSIEDVEFHSIAKGWYGLFRRNMTSWVDPTVDTRTGLIVVSGMAPGMATSSAAIIAKDGLGGLAAATIDGDFERILYFTNRSKWRLEIPEPIQSWADRFNLELVLVDYS